ncbi:SOS response-associated peptidase family protein [Agarivorans sp. DSG3-1]|uniref:SOS response-associated peptidase family protein n=1 Tax=Agarivorans sp. DSG3-1 TaxID=3342249 RepID=UPI00398F2869
MCGSVMIGGEYEIRQVIGVDSLFLDFGETKQYRPRESLPAITFTQGKLTCEHYLWGVQHSQTSQLIINARAETAADKAMFSQAWLNQRCLLPVKAWHEWRNQERFEFRLDHSHLLLLGALYIRQHQHEQARLVVLTQNASSQLTQYHHRMPLLFELESGLAWLAGQASQSKPQQFHYHVSSNSPQLGLF